MKNSNMMCDKSVYLADISTDMIDAVNKGFKEGYNKAIDDFFDELEKYEETYKEEDWLKLKMCSIYYIAEQLKAGEINKQVKTELDKIEERCKFMDKAFEKIMKQLEKLKDEKEIGSHKVIIKEAQGIVQKVAEEYSEKYNNEPAKIIETVGSNRLDCEVPSDYFNDIKEVRVIDEWTEETKIFKAESKFKEKLNLKKEEYSNRWIPCSEQLPKISGYYLVTYHEWSNGNYLPQYDNTCVRRLHYQISDHFTGWNYPRCVNKNAESDTNREVLAWQTLPEIYKAKDISMKVHDNALEDEPELD